MLCIIILQLIEPPGFVCADIKAVFILRKYRQEIVGCMATIDVRKSFVHSFIHELLNESLLIPGTVIGTKDKKRNEVFNSLCPGGTYTKV